MMTRLLNIILLTLALFCGTLPVCVGQEESRVAPQTGALEQETELRAGGPSFSPLKRPLIPMPFVDESIRLSCDDGLVFLGSGKFRFRHEGRTEVSPWAEVTTQTVRTSPGDASTESSPPPSTQQETKVTGSSIRMVVEGPVHDLGGSGSGVFFLKGKGSYQTEGPTERRSGDTGELQTMVPIGGYAQALSGGSWPPPDLLRKQSSLEGKTSAPQPSLIQRVGQ